ncbi:RND efflux membrane fusion protein [Desulfosporosinus sp. BG]|nr:RND efflux membrane fusion protein [Desulfosporosinus sp. BG]
MKTNTVQSGTTTVKNSYSGEVRGIYESPLSFQVSGKVIKRNVDPGSIVHSGDVLLAIDTKDIEQTVNIASVQLDTGNSKLNLAEITLNRNRELLKAGAISQEAYDLCQKKL